MTRTDIDTTPLDELTGIRKDQARLDAFRERAAAQRTQVDARVYDRVMADYDARRASLDARARPLLARAAQEYRALRTLRTSVESTHETAQLAREELRFRHAVGELDDATLAEQAREPEQTLARCGAELAALDALQARFIEAAGSAEALEESQEEAPTLSDTASEPVAPAESSQTNIFMIADVPDNLPGNAPGNATDDATDDALDEASRGRSDTVAALSPNTVIGSAALLIEASDIASDTTSDGAPDGARHHLGLTTTVGRSDENSLVLANPSVSRLHAILEATADGYTLRDLHSQNGTFVNGARVDAHPLRDGDEVIFGDARYIFHAFAGGAPTSPSPQGADRGRDDS